jgi:hypothetical protein
MLCKNCGHPADQHEQEEDNEYCLECPCRHYATSASSLLSYGTSSPLDDPGLLFQRYAFDRRVGHGKSPQVDGPADTPNRKPPTAAESPFGGDEANTVGREMERALEGLEELLK